MRASKCVMIWGKRRVQAFLFLLGLLVVVARAQEPEETADATRDTLVYKDGDRVRGHLVERTADLIVFKSDRFGELRVPAADAVVIKAEKPATPVKQVVAQGIKPAPTPEEKAEQEKLSIWERYSPAVLTAKVRDFFGPWHGRVAFSNEIVTDTAHRNNLALEGKIARKFEKDAVELSSRYDYDETNGSPTTDRFRAIGSWRHDFNRRQFGQYRPTVEWNRANLRPNGLPNEYILVQQEIGFGLNVLSTPARKFRVGVSENLFDVWDYNVSSHTSKALVSLFEETELALPWRMAITQRGVWYPETVNQHGFEDQIELNKKLTETLSVALRHEIRRNNPDGASQDYTRLKLLLGLDF